MSKKQDTKTMILEHAAVKASQVGLNGLSIGSLASELGLSKSGLFGHFKSKQAMQQQVLETIAYQFIQAVSRPALKKPRGPERLQALFDHWLAWAAAQDSQRNGCPFVQASMEFDDREGGLRDKVVELQQEWIGVIETTIKLGQKSGAFHQDISYQEAAQELYGMMLSYHLYFRLLKTPDIGKRTQNIFQEFLKKLTI